MKIPVHIGSYLASVSNRLLRRNRTPLDRTQFDRDECVSLDHRDPLSQTLDEKKRSDEIIVPPIPIGFAIPGGANQRFESSPFSEPIGPNNNAAAWMGLGVAVSAFVLVFGGYVAIVGMGNPATLRRAEAFIPRTVMGMTWLPGDLAAFPELPASSATTTAPASDAGLLADRQATSRKENAVAPAQPARDRTRAGSPAARNEATLHTADACTSKNQRGCYRKYATKAPPIDPFGGAAANGPRRVQRDFDQPMQWHGESTVVPPHASTTYLHH
ncbi:hypothetical protein [Paraburkholderia humisilvae]|uniref:Uncharacterized protein n=1 Tax=Paraburkholderia humisilvae TaxID=627669 RepID=A0A6J5D667_9BURK|nr:hypothetical protein [Paraburkholderia humisilvae]CAB3748692.1 hypothetical protein LMG29542_00740 [Paraburkholderia humisilvae]